MINKDKINKMSMSELLTYREAAEMLHEYYDNVVKSTIGDYHGYMITEHNEALRETNKYKEILKDIFEIIKKKVDDIV